MNSLPGFRVMLLSTWNFWGPPSGERVPEIESSTEENKAKRGARERPKEWGANTGPEDVV